MSLTREMFAHMNSSPFVPGREVILEVEQELPDGRLKFETMILVGPEFDLEEPFVFKLYDNKSDKKAFGVSGNFTELVESIASQMQKKKPKKPKASQ